MEEEEGCCQRVGFASLEGWNGGGRERGREVSEWHGMTGPTARAARRRWKCVRCGRLIKVSGRSPLSLSLSCLSAVPLSLGVAGARTDQFPDFLRGERLLLSKHAAPSHPVINS